MDQVSVRGMNLDHFKSGDQSAMRSGRECLHHAPNTGSGQLTGSRIAFKKRHGARSDDLPAVRLVLRNESAAVPRHLGAGFAPGVRQLDARYGTLALDERRDALQRFNMLRLPDAQI